jgi:hypothetical protein
MVSGTTFRYRMRQTLHVGAMDDGRFEVRSGTGPGAHKSDERLRRVPEIRIDLGGNSSKHR